MGKRNKKIIAVIIFLTALVTLGVTFVFFKGARRFEEQNDELRNILSSSVRVKDDKIVLSGVDTKIYNISINYDNKESEYCVNISSKKAGEIQELTQVINNNGEYVWYLKYIFKDIYYEQFYKFAIGIYVVFLAINTCFVFGMIMIIANRKLIRRRGKILLKRVFPY